MANPGFLSTEPYFTPHSYGRDITLPYIFINNIPRFLQPLGIDELYL